MPRVEFQDNALWERYYAEEEAQEERGQEEHSRTEGNDGEESFDRLVLNSARGRDMIDIGCGSGEFTLEMAAVARRAAGVDFSQRAIEKALKKMRARKTPNVEFKLAEARQLPYPNVTFDLAISRRGPASDSAENIREAHRILRKGGKLMMQEIGERDKLNWKEVFGRGQNYPFEGTVATEEKKLLAQAGFQGIVVREFDAIECFESIKDVLVRLETSPIIPDFDKARDLHYINEIARLYTTRKGIRTNTHRVLVTATKQP